MARCHPLKNTTNPRGVLVGDPTIHKQFTQRAEKRRFGLEAERAIAGNVQRTCSIDPAGLTVAQQWIADRRSVWEKRLDRLGEMLAENDET